MGKDIDKKDDKRGEAMTGKVQIDIKGVRTIDGQREQVDETGTGEYYKRNGKHYVIGTSEDGAIKRMKFTVDSMSVTGKGGGSMVFEAGKETRTFYGTPAGYLELEFHTREFCLREEDEFLEAKVRYALYQDGMHVSDNCMVVTLQPQGPKAS